MNQPSATIEWPAPAKINLFLHITGRREDGYHNLQTIFQFLDFGDQIALTPRDDGVIRLTTPLAGVDPAQDLTVRAAHRLRQVTGCRGGVDIGITKRLPMGGGLGGGSSDAATTLLLLNRLWRCGADPSTLGSIGLSLGADLPIFLAGHAAWAEGVGEQLTPITPQEGWLLLAWPQLRLPTAELFGDPSLTRNTPPIKIADFSFGTTRNDFEPVARRRYPEVGRLLAALGQYGQARMSGSGGSCYVAFGRREEAERACRSLSRHWSAVVCRRCNCSPLHAELARAEESGWLNP